MKTFYPLFFWGTLLSATIPVPASAQNLTQPAAHAPNDWHSVQALPALTRIRLITDKKKTTCFIDSVTDDHLICSSSSSKGSTQAEYPKAEIKQIQIPHRSRSHSTAVGAAVGLGTGAGLGALFGIAINSEVAYHTTTAKAAGAGAAVGATAGVIAGAALGSATDWAGGSTVVYRRP
jgi:hypothetical protein